MTAAQYDIEALKEQDLNGNRNRKERSNAVGFAKFNC